MARKTMKNKNKKYYPYLLISLLLISILLILYFSVGQSFIAGGSKVNVIGNSGSMWELQAVGGAGGDFSIIRINEPTKADVWAEGMCKTLEATSGQTCRPQGATEPSATYRNYVSVTSDQVLGDKILIIEGNYNGQSFKTYGFSKASDRIIRDIKDPFPDETQAVTPTSIKAYFKVGGYNENNICEEFGLNCPESINVFRFENNQCTLKTILESEITNNDYGELSDCENNIISPIGDDNGTIDDGGNINVGGDDTGDNGGNEDDNKEELNFYQNRTFFISLIIAITLLIVIPLILIIFKNKK